MYLDVSRVDQFIITEKHHLNHTTISILHFLLHVQGFTDNYIKSIHT